MAPFKAMRLHVRKRPCRGIFVLAIWATFYGLSLTPFTVVRGQNTLRPVLPSAQQPELVVQTGHADDINSVVFSPDGKKLATASDDFTIKLWDVESGREIRSFEGHIFKVSCVAFSPDGKILASGGEAVVDTIRLWNVGSGKQIASLKGHASSLTFSSDGKLLITGGAGNKTIQFWDVTSGRELRSPAGHREVVNCIALSPNGKFLASGSGDNTIKLWNVASRQLLKSLDGGSSHGIASVAFSPDGRTLASGSSLNGKTKLWDVESGKEIRSLAESSAESIAFSPDGKLVATGSISDIIKFWSVESGQELRSLLGHTSVVRAVTFAPNGKMLASSSDDDTIRLWSVESGLPFKILESHASLIGSVAFSSDGTMVASGSRNNKIKLWNLQSGRQTGSTESDGARKGPMAFLANGSLGWTSHLKTIERWDPETGQRVNTSFGDLNSISTASFSPDGRSLATGGRGSVTLWDIESGKTLGSFNDGLDFTQAEAVESLAFSPDGQTLASGSYDGAIILWDKKDARRFPRPPSSRRPALLTKAKPRVAATGPRADQESQTRYLQRPLTRAKMASLSLDISDAIKTLAFSPSGKLLASGSADNTVKLWDVQSLRLVRTFKGHTDSVKATSFSPDGSILATGSYDNTVKLWHVESGREIRVLKGHTSGVESIAFSPNGDLLATGSWDATMKLWDVDSGKLLATMISLDKDDWVVVSVDGLFDASPGGRQLMHYALGNETFTLDQMKGTFYMPGLLSKILTEKPLPKVNLFSENDLFPLVEFSQPKSGQKDLSIKLTPRDGGIGQVQILVNGKEFVRDARPMGVDLNTEAPLSMSVSLAGAPLIAGGNNKIEVIARNAIGSLTNRGTRGAELVYQDDGPQKAETPNVYIIAGGISDYTGDNLDLGFAAKDAEDFARALEIGAAKLIGDKSKVHIRLLTSSGDNGDVKFGVPDSKISMATKADFERAFEDFKGATPNDVFIVYLAGHGVSLNLNQNPNQAGGDTYLYLTQEATTTDKSVLAIENSRKAMTISSEELKDMMKKNKALKQVLILDTCAAGALSNSLVAKRDLPSDQIRAIERLKDNTGFFVLMGTSADSVSYEASQYGQGLLTYSLLQGMKGAKLRENQFADVSQLFTYAQDTVPTMAKNIGGVQRPLIITPDNSASFDIGKFTTDEQRQIILSNKKPILLAPTLFNPVAKRDNLRLSKMMADQLRELSYVSGRGTQTKIVFVAAEEMVDAYQPSGTYTLEGDNLKILMILVKNNAPFGNEITVTGKANEPEEVIKQLVEAVMRALN